MRRLAPVLFILAVAGLVVALGVPALVSAIAPGVIRGLGPFAGQPVTVTVDAGLGGLLAGRLDRVMLTGAATAGDSNFSGLRLTIVDVRFDRTFGSVTGSAATITSTALSVEPLTLRDVVIAGSSVDGLRIVGRIEAAVVKARILAGLGQLGTLAPDVTLEDAGVSIGLLGLAVHARFEVATDGTIRLVPDGPLPPVTVLEPGGSTPGRAVGVEVTPAGLTIHWLIDAAQLAALIGG